MPLYIADYIRDTSRLTTEGHGAYLLLIFDYWVSGRPLPDDDQQLAAVARLPASRWKALRPSIERFFQTGDGFWHHKRIDAELAEATDRIGKRSAAGKAGAAAKWGAKDGKSNADADGNRIGKSNADAYAQSQVTPSSLRSEGSVAYATGADAPSFDPVKEIFDRGLKILGQAQRSLLGKLRKQHGDVAVLEAICACESEHPTDPAPFLIRSCEAHSAPKRKSPSTTLWEGAYNAAQNYIRDHGIDRDDNLPAQPLLDSGRPPRIA
jgi:uncharacterized protein YdaU (DUF1376 family)